MRNKREDFFPSELYWLDRIPPTSFLHEAHGGAPTTVEELITFDPNGQPLTVAFDRLVEPDWADFIARELFLSPGLTILDARVTTNWPTSAGLASWKGYDAPYMILNLHELLMRLAIAGAGRIRMYGYRHPRPISRKYIPLPWWDVFVVGLLIERGDTPRLEYEESAPRLLDLDWP